MAAKPSEFDKFDSTMDDLLKVPYSQIRADLDAEKKAKAERKAAGVMLHREPNRAERHKFPGVLFPSLFPPDGREVGFVGSLRAF
jgi:hypothetical protein